MNAGFKWMLGIMAGVIVMFFLFAGVVPMLLSSVDFARGQNIGFAVRFLEGHGYVVAAPGGGFASDFLPSVNNTFAIGRADLQWSELFVASNSIHLGGQVISADADGIQIPGHFVVSGFIKAIGPVQIRNGFQLIDPSTDAEKFHIFVSGLHTQTPGHELPDAFDSTLIIETRTIDNANFMEVVFWDADNGRPSLVLNQGAPGRATVIERSLIIGADKGTRPLDGSYTLGPPTFTHLAFDTAVYGADFAVENDVEILGTLYVGEAVILPAGGADDWTLDNGSGTVRLSYPTLSHSLEIASTGDTTLYATGAARFLFAADGQAYKSTGPSAWMGLSDRALKQNIVSSFGALGILTQLTPITYEWNATYGDRYGVRTGRFFGFIAQDVQPILPSMVVERDGNMYSSVGDFDAILVKAIQELEERVAALESP